MQRYCALALGLLAFVIGCAEVPKKRAATPEACLKETAYSNTAHPEKNYWWGDAEDQTRLRVKLFGSASKAQNVVKEATDIDAKAAKRYAVLGTVKGKGSANAVAAVAACLKGL